MMQMDLTHAGVVSCLSPDQRDESMKLQVIPPEVYLWQLAHTDGLVSMLIKLVTCGLDKLYGIRRFEDRFEAGHSFHKRSRGIESYYFNSKEDMVRLATDVFRICRMTINNQDMFDAACSYLIEAHQGHEMHKIISQAIANEGASFNMFRRMMDERKQRNASMTKNDTQLDIHDANRYDRLSGLEKNVVHYLGVSKDDLDSCFPTDSPIVRELVLLELMIYGLGRTIDNGNQPCKPQPQRYNSFWRSEQVFVGARSQDLAVRTEPPTQNTNLSWF